MGLGAVAMMRCDVCGSEDSDTSGQKGHLVAFHCKKCGREQVMFVSTVDDDAPPSARRDPVFKLVGCWFAEPTANDIAEVLRQVPLMFWSADDLLEKCATRESFELGCFTLPELEMKLPVLTKVGLELTTIPVAEGT